MVQTPLYVCGLAWTRKMPRALHQLVLLPYESEKTPCPCSLLATLKDTTTSHNQICPNGDLRTLFVMKAHFSPVPQCVTTKIAADGQRSGLGDSHCTFGGAFSSKHKMNKIPRSKEKLRLLQFMRRSSSCCLPVPALIRKIPACACFLLSCIC